MKNACIFVIIPATDVDVDVHLRCTKYYLKPVGIGLSGIYKPHERGGCHQIVTITVLISESAME